MKKHHMRRHIRKPHKKNHRKKTQNTSRKGVWLMRLLWLLFFCGVIYVVFYRPFMHVTDIEIGGSVRSDVNRLEEVFHESTQGQNVLLMERKHLWLIDTEAYRKMIVENMPEVKDIHVKKIFPHTISIEVTEYDLIVVLCGYEVAANRCVIYDFETGKTLSEYADFASPHLTQNTVLPIVLQRDIALDEEVIDTDTLENIKYFYNNVVYQGDVHVATPYVAQSLGVRDFYLMTDDGWELRMDFTQDAQHALTRLQTLFDHTDLGVQRRDISYIDMRHGDRVFYKMRSAEVAEVSEIDDSLPQEGDAGVDIEGANAKKSEDK